MLATKNLYPQITQITQTEQPSCSSTGSKLVSLLPLRNLRNLRIVLPHNKNTNDCFGQRNCLSYVALSFLLSENEWS